MEQAELTRLIQKSLEGDRQAQEKLAEAAQNRVYYHCKKILKNEQDALDATQDVLITIVTGLDKLREPAAFWGWVNGITANRCRRLLSRRPEEWQIPEDDEGNSMLDGVETLDDQTVPDKALDNDETRRMMMELIEALPPEQKLCVLFFYYDEMSVKEIAQATGAAEGTVKSRLNYARKAIKDGVERYAAKGAKLYSFAPLPFPFRSQRRKRLATPGPGPGQRGGPNKSTGSSGRYRYCPDRPHVRTRGRKTTSYSWTVFPSVSIQPPRIKELPLQRPE